MTQPWITAVITNTFALIVLLIMFFNATGKYRRFQLTDQTLFQWMLITNMLILLMDAGTWVLNGTTFYGAHALNLFCTTSFYILDPVMSLLYIIYCDIKLGVPIAKRRRLILWYSLPVLINLVLALLSIRYGILFRVNADNTYARAPFLWLSFLLSYLLLGVALVRVLRSNWKLRKAKKWSYNTAIIPGKRGMCALEIFPLIPLVGGILQVHYAYVTVVWLSTVLALLVLFINEQNVEISTDPLTGLYNRKQTDIYLQNLLQSNLGYDRLCLMMIDVDNFKRINDEFGHLKGDQALRILASAMRAECDKRTFFSRYGGDEFVICALGCDMETLCLLPQRLNRWLADYCLSMKLPFSLSISAGVAQWSQTMSGLDALYAEADAKLYQDKAKMKRRSGDRG